MGCIIFQMLTGKTPFHDTNEYRVFEKIIKCSYEIPSSVENDASHLIQSLLKTDPSSRLGSKETGGFDELRNHPFFDVINWKNLSDQEPPRIAKRILTLDDDGYATFRQKKGIQRLQCSDPDDVDGYGLSITMSDEERLRRLDLQTKTKWDSYSTGGLILKQGALQKKRGLSLKVRYFLLTDTPKLVYIDPDTMELKGEIPWSDKMQTEVKTFKVFFIHVPGRTYHLIDKTGNAIKWCKKIEEVKEHFMTHPE
uniref:3-phosphoinositide-dependent protein kinase 1 n=1 Tax=Phallusia mammillata TaxID=59560 RepID=A0A6F9DNP4_9ASCI|nr:3-phosphoinositide-dependent protein kinase 1 [Phallusia mammillata]